MNRVTGFPARRRPCRLTLPTSDLGSLRSPIKLFFSEVLVIWTWDHGHLSLGTLDGSTQGAGFKSCLTWKCVASSGPHFPKRLADYTSAVQTCLTPGSHPCSAQHTEAEQQWSQALCLCILSHPMQMLQGLLATSPCAVQ